jgi:hypothetical protein
VDKKKILIVSRSFYPEISPRSHRTTELAKEFARRGHEVTVLTPKKADHVDFEKMHRLTIKDLGKKLFSGININRKNKFTSLFFRAMRRGLNLFFEYPDIGFMFQVAKKLKNESGYDLLISIAAPHSIHWGVSRIWKRNSIIAKTWVADCGDPYMMATGDTFSKLFYFKVFEKSFCKKADYITVPVEEAKSAYYPEFLEKIEVIPQGFKFPVIKTSDKQVNNSIITFAYSGTIIPYKNFAIPFLNLLNEYKKPFIFLVFTKNKDFYYKYMNQEAIDKYKISSYISRTELINSLLKVDFLVYFPYKKQSQKPLKLIDYHFTGKPILEYRNDNISRQAFYEFMDFNFSKRIPAEDINQYRIENVSARFLSLTQIK